MVTEAQVQERLHELLTKQDRWPEAKEALEAEAMALLWVLAGRDVRDDWEGWCNRRFVGKRPNVPVWHDVGMSMKTFARLIFEFVKSEFLRPLEWKPLIEDLMDKGKE